jgi:hypothetical protein
MEVTVRLMSDGELTRLEVLRDLDQCRLTRVTPKSLHGVDLGVETLRQWMIDAGLWVRRKDRLKRIHQPRALGAIASANWCRSTVPSTGGSRIAGCNAGCWGL